MRPSATRFPFGFESSLGFDYLRETKLIQGNPTHLTLYYNPEI